jgi:hypothetical protein
MLKQIKIKSGKFWKYQWLFTFDRECTAVWTDDEGCLWVSRDIRLRCHKGVDFSGFAPKHWCRDPDLYGRHIRPIPDWNPSKLNPVSLFAYGLWRRLRPVNRFQRCDRVKPFYATEYYNLSQYPWGPDSEMVILNWNLVPRHLTGTVLLWCVLVQIKTSNKMVHVATRQSRYNIF